VKIAGRDLLLSLTAFVLLSLTGCVKIPEQQPPPITTTLFPSTIAKLPPPPPELSYEEAASNWGVEYRLGKVFAEEGDFYRALSAFHRARILLPEKSSRRPHLIHAIVLTYSLGKKYQEAVDIWEQERHLLNFEDEALKKDCIQLLFEAYCRIGNVVEASRLLEKTSSDDPLRKTLPLFHTISINNDKEFIEAPQAAKDVGPKEEEDAETIVAWYKRERKNPTTARLLNTFLPGSGYAYVRQYQTALTSFALNVLFITATVQLFCAEQHAAALIAGGFEIGWYLGGITGAQLAAYTYNQRLREYAGKPYLERHKLFPLQTVRYSW
jgi:tetratricopeptide (TPR) repeat protein